MVYVRSGFRVICQTTASRWHCRRVPSDAGCPARSPTHSERIRGLPSGLCCKYSIYSNDMPLFVEDADIIQYADDTQVLVTGSKHSMAQNVLKMEHSLFALSWWFRQIP